MNGISRYWVVLQWDGIIVGCAAGNLLVRTILSVLLAGCCLPLNFVWCVEGLLSSEAKFDTVVRVSWLGGMVCCSACILCAGIGCVGEDIWHVKIITGCF